MSNDNNELMIYDRQSLKAVSDIRKAITEKHKAVSSQSTPKPYIKKKMGLDYVEYGFMREIVDKEFPGWSWTIIKTEMFGTAAFMVHGRLKWFDEGIWREGDMTAAHRIQKKRGTDEFVDIGNDIKAANTDCIKKAFNMYLNVCDDVYRNQVEDLELTDDQKDEIVSVAAKVSKERHSEIAELVSEQTIHTGNYKSSLAKINREAGL
jgi:ribosomal protein L32E|tara:strand:+ start:392 stop:1012 length:621 start_codon:yes stop_codon:yes gene_type:complete